VTQESPVARSASGAEADCSDRDYTDDALKQMGRRAEDAARQERLRRKTAHEAWQGAGAGRAGAAGPHEAPGAAEEAAEEAPEVRVWGLEAHGFRALLPGRWPPRGTLPQVKAKLPVPLTPRARWGGRAQPPGLTFCFGSAGWLFVYYLGVIKCLKEFGLHKNAHCISCSGGALAAAAGSSPRHTQQTPNCVLDTPGAPSRCGLTGLPGVCPRA
jgi:hypothetical protein